MDQTDLERLYKIVNGNDWKVIRGVFEKHLQKLKSNEDIDLTLEPSALREELIARRRAAETIIGILNEVCGYGVQEKTNPLNRSMK